MSTATSYGVGLYKAGEASVVATDRAYNSAGGLRRGVVCAHGAQQSAAVWFSVPWYISTFTNAGYPWIGCDFGGGGTSGAQWGNDDSISAVGSAISTLLTGGLKAKSDKVYLFGTSMGALTVLNWARQNVSSVGGVALVIPALDLNDIYTNNKNGYQAPIGTAYGVTFPTALPTLSTHSPVAYGSSDLAGIPIALWTSDNDPIASTTAAAHAWVLGGAAGATVVSHTSLGNSGHTTNALDFSAVLAFFDNHGGRN